MKLWSSVNVLCNHTHVQYVANRQQMLPQGNVHQFPGRPHPARSSRLTPTPATRNFHHGCRLACRPLNPMLRKESIPCCEYSSPRPPLPCCCSPAFLLPPPATGNNGAVPSEITLLKPARMFRSIGTTEKTPSGRPQFPVADTPHPLSSLTSSLSAQPTKPHKPRLSPLSIAAPENLNGSPR